MAVQLPPSPYSFAAGTAASVGLVLLYCVSRGIYNAFFHPLRHFPGPKLWSTTFLFRHVAAMRGQLDWSIKAFHDKYGDVVRFSPDELSFSSEQAWKDIYGHRDVPLVKDPGWYSIVKGPGGAQSIFNAGPQSHPRMRKQLSHAFSEKALRDQEDYVKTYVELLIHKLRDVASAGAPADMVKWYNFTTFDMIGDLALGKTFGCLKDSQYHTWVSNIFNSIKIGPFIRTMAAYTDVQSLMRLLAPASVKEARRKHELYVEVHAKERMDKGIMEERKDFISYILKHREDKNSLTDNEIAANCGFLILAGSETTATALSGLTYHLLKVPDCLHKVTEEVRSAFSSEEEINFLNANARLPYTMACISEGLRMYPPGPSLLPRRTPSGGASIIDGCQVPGWTLVGVHALTTTRKPANFHKPNTFIPERWLPSSTADPSSPFYHDRRGASQPFSTGPRNCLGKSLAYNEMRVILAKLLWNFDLELCSESKDWDNQLTYTLWEKRPLMCRLHDVRKGE
ncbi:putative cytochrome P450 monooxygenase [Glonium stellatum]|uniref:Putative cytochrome P450 monooxygenase n=1 Tax=Glonium stellatum TaxID=574774 RepID=A0A8E2EQK7_9PEZI|nr:putative cytochrome P450 monooxygenase [Glonium stellatum]